MRIGIVYGAKEQNADRIAQDLSQYLQIEPDAVLDASQVSAEELSKYDLLIAGMAFYVRREVEEQLGRMDDTFPLLDSRKGILK